MTGDCHVRFGERLAGRFRRPTQLDFVQKDAGPIGGVLKELYDVLNPWLGDPKWKQTQGCVTFYYRYESEISPVRNMNHGSRARCGRLKYNALALSYCF